MAGFDRSEQLDALGAALGLVLLENGFQAADSSDRRIHTFERAGKRFILSLNQSGPRALVTFRGTGALTKAEYEFDLSEFFSESEKDEWASKLLKNRDRLAAICRRLLSGFEQDLLPGGGSLVGPDHPLFHGVRPARFDPIFPPGRAPPSRYGDELPGRYGDALPPPGFGSFE